MKAALLAAVALMVVLAVLLRRPASPTPASSIDALIARSLELDRLLSACDCAAPSALSTTAVLGALLAETVAADASVAEATAELAAGAAPTPPTRSEVPSSLLPTGPLTPTARSREPWAFASEALPALPPEAASRPPPPTGKLAAAVTKAGAALLPLGAARSVLVSGRAARRIAARLAQLRPLSTAVVLNSTAGAPASGELPRNSLVCDAAGSTAVLRRMFLSNELFALQWLGDWNVVEAAGALALAMHSIVLLPASWGQDESAGLALLLKAARSAGVEADVSFVPWAEATSLLAVVTVRSLRRSTEHHYRVIGEDNPAAARLLHIRYRLEYSRAVAAEGSQQVMITRLSDNSKISFEGGMGVTLQTLGSLGLGATARSRVLHALVRMPMFEDLAPWNLMLTSGASILVYVDHESRDRALDAVMPLSGVLSLALGSFERAARQLGICLAKSGPTLYGKSIPYVAACTDGDFARSKPYPCRASLSKGVACLDRSCASTFVHCLRHRGLWPDRRH